MRRSFLLAVAFAAVILSGCATGSAIAATTDCASAPVERPASLPVSLSVPATDAFDAVNLSARFAALVAKTDATQAQMAVLMPDGTLLEAQTGDTTADDVFWWASVGKMVTAAVVLQQVEEGKLSLNDTLDMWLPGLPEARFITLEQMLTHTSGLFSFNADKTVQAETGYKSPDRLFGTAERQGADFCPGKNWVYSNTNYLALGEIAARVDGKPFAQVVQDRIATPLGLDSLSVLTRGSEVNVVAPAAQSRFDADDVASIGGAGAIVFDSADGARLLKALLDGHIVPETRLREMLSETYPMFGSPMRYGQGIMVIDVPDDTSPHRWIGHSGGSPDAKGLLVRDQATGAVFAIVLNTQAPAEAILNALLRP